MSGCKSNNNFDVVNALHIDGSPNTIVTRRGRKVQIEKEIFLKVAKAREIGNSP